MKYRNFQTETLTEARLTGVISGRQGPDELKRLRRDTRYPCGRQSITPEWQRKREVSVPAAGMQWPEHTSSGGQWLRRSLHQKWILCNRSSGKRASSWVLWRPGRCGPGTHLPGPLQRTPPLATTVESHQLIPCWWRLENYQQNPTLYHFTICS